MTLLSVTGFAYAINIIDGRNGLASMCAALMLVAIAYMAFQIDDRAVALQALAGNRVIAGFFGWNSPRRPSSSVTAAPASWATTSHALCAALMLVAARYVGFGISDRVVALLRWARIRTIKRTFFWSYRGETILRKSYAVDPRLLLMFRKPEAAPL